MNSHRRRLILQDRHVPLPRIVPATELMVAELPERCSLLDPILFYVVNGILNKPSTVFSMR